MTSTDEPGSRPAGDTTGPLAEELRRLLDAVVDRAGTAVPATGTAGTAGEGARDGRAPDCGWCPVCAVVAALRGERPELTRRLGEQGAGLAAALRALLEDHEHGGAPAPDDPSGSAAGPGRSAGAARVQRIPVRVSEGPPR
ncbi:hypothetical protein [Rhodococcus aerolatus]